MNRNVDEKIERIRHLLQRADRPKKAEQRLRKLHPEAAGKAISTLAFHMYTDGSLALVDLLVQQEEFLAGVRTEVSYGAIHHVLYHLYNYTLAERLLVPDRQEIAADLRDVLSEVAEEPPDLAAIKGQLTALCAKLEGHDSPPSLD